MSGNTSTGHVVKPGEYFGLGERWEKPVLFVALVEFDVKKTLEEFIEVNRQKYNEYEVDIENDFFTELMNKDLAKKVLPVLTVNYQNTYNGDSPVELTSYNSLGSKVTGD